MNYISIIFLGSKLNSGIRIGKIAGNYTKQQVCLKSSSRGYVSSGSNCLQGGISMKTGIVSKRNCGIMAQRQNGISCIECRDYQLTLVRRNDFLVFVRCMAGHSKWQNIRHIKAAKDQEKSVVIQKYSLAIKKAVIEGGANPRGNSKLAQLLEEAKKFNVPNATIERTIAKAKTTPCKPTVIEIQGPGGCILVVEAETDNEARFAHDVKLLCRKLRAIILPKGRYRSAYDQRGVIVVKATKDNKALDYAKATDIAIEAGAEDVQEIENESEGKSLQFLCHPDDLYTVKKHIESTNYIIDEASIRYIARDDAKVDLSDEQMESLENLYNQLEALSEVTNIYDNIN